MSLATLKAVAQLAGVAPVTVSRVVNGSENVAAATREKILAIIRDSDYTPNIHAANLRRKRMNHESPKKDRDVGAGNRPGVRFNSSLDLPCSPEPAGRVNSERDKALATQLIQLRKDLDRLRTHTERIQTCVEMIQEAYR